MVLSVVVCTNRVTEGLVKLVRSLCKQTADLDVFEVIVVYNGGRKPPEAILSLTRVSRNFRIVVEREENLSRARNLGLKHAKGIFVAYLDDDVSVRCDYVEKVLGAIRTVPDTVACIVGPVESVFLKPSPPWLSGRLREFFSVLDYGDKPKLLDLRKENIIGTNMVFRKSCLIELGGFDESLGRRGGILLSNEENFVKYKMMVKGLAVYYDPSVKVFHNVRTDRINLKWLYRRAYWQGVSNFVLYRKVNIFRYYSPKQLIIKGGMFFFLFPLTVLCAIPLRSWVIVYIRCLTLILVAYIVSMVNYR